MQWLMAFDAANLVMLYLLGVVVVALFYGRWPSVVATVINVVSFDLFIAPRGTLAVSDVQYLLTFAVMLTVGLVDREPYCGRALSGAGSPLPRATHTALI